MNNRSKGPIPPGKAGLIVIAAALAPLVLVKCKPTIKKMARSASDFFDKMAKFADDAKAEAKPEPGKTRVRSKPAASRKPKTAAKRPAVRKPKPEPT